MYKIYSNIPDRRKDTQENTFVNLKSKNFPFSQCRMKVQICLSCFLFIDYYLFKLSSMQHSHDVMSGSSPLFPSDPTKTNIESDNQSSKTMSRFPPIKAKNEQTPGSKEKDFVPALVKKGSQDTAGQTFKKQHLGPKKKIEKKKGKGPSIKPQIMQKYKTFLDFTGLVNLTNNLKVIVTESIPNYVFYVGKGNNSSLIKQLFRTYRPWWTLQEFNPSAASINLHWYQLRQNQILDDFKENMKGNADFDGCSYFIEEGEVKQEKGATNQETEKEEKRKGSRSVHRKTQERSQSVTHKDLKSTMGLGMTKRSSSRPKKLPQQNSNLAALANLNNVKEDIEGEEGPKKKRVLANPKMWPIYTNYRRVFSHSDLKQLKKLKVIEQDGRINVKLSRNKLKLLQNRSNYIKMHNHVTNNWNVSNKKALFMNLKNYYEVQKINPFEYIPMTFHITDITDKEFGKFQEEYERRTDIIKEDEKKKKGEQLKHGFRPRKRNAWLVKPGENTNRGTGIQVLQNIQEIKEIIGREKTDKQGRPRTHIVQQYIMPFLYQKRKFDIRTYVCLTSINGYQKVYWYQDGYLRTASKQFNMKNLNNKFIHLTNDAVQKYHEDYGKFQPGNKLSYADFQRHLDTVYNVGVESSQKLRFYQQAYPEMKKLAADIFRSVYTKINPTKKQFTFQIFGLDYMIDDNFKVWLIQCNTNPCLELSCPLLSRLIPNMLENAFKMVIDPLFPPPLIEDVVNLSKKLMLPDNMMETNKFQLIFDEVDEGRQLRSLLSTTPEVKLVEVQEQDEDEYDQNGNQCCQKSGKVEVVHE